MKIAANELYEKGKDFLSFPGKEVHAVQIFNAYIKIYPDSLDGWIYYGNALLGVRLSMIARDVCEKISNSPLFCEKKRIPIFNLCGRLAREMGEYEKAENYFSEAYKDKTPQPPSILVLRASGFINLENYEKALKYLEKADEIYETKKFNEKLDIKCEILINKGFVFLAKEKFSDANNCFKSALLIEKDNSSANYALNILDALEEAEDIAQKIAKKHYRNDQLDELYLAIHESASNNWNPLIIVKTFKEYLMIKPENGLAWIWYGRALKELGQWRKATLCLKKAINCVPDDLKPGVLKVIHLELADTTQRFSTRNETEKYYKIAFSYEKPKESIHWLRRGINLSFIGDFGEAFKCFEVALDLSEDRNSRGETLYEMGVVFRAENNFEKAQESFEKAIQLSPNNEALIALKGLAGIEETLDLVNNITHK